MDVQVLMTISSDHLSDATKKRIKDGEVHAKVFRTTDNGYLIYAPEEAKYQETIKEIEKDLAMIFLLANINGVNAVFLHKSGEVLSELPNYSEEGERMEIIKEEHIKKDKKDELLEAEKQLDVSLGIDPPWGD